MGLKKERESERERAKEQLFSGNALISSICQDVSGRYLEQIPIKTDCITKFAQWWKVKTKQNNNKKKSRRQMLFLLGRKSILDSTLVMRIKIVKGKLFQLSPRNYTMAIPKGCKLFRAWLTRSSIRHTYRYGRGKT